MRSLSSNSSTAAEEGVPNRNAMAGATFAQRKKSNWPEDCCERKRQGGRPRGENTVLETEGGCAVGRRHCPEEKMNFLIGDLFN